MEQCITDVNIPDDGETFYSIVWNYAGLFKQNALRSYNLPVVKDVLAKYEDPSKQLSLCEK